MSLYANDGTFNVTVLSGGNSKGIHAADGSYNVTLSDGHGVYNRNGSYNVTLAGSHSGLYAPDGSFYVTTTPTNRNGPMRVTVVSGSLTPSTLTTANNLLLLLY